MIICSCKGITKKEILRVVKKGAVNIADIQHATTAATGCGRCKSTIDAIIIKEIGEPKTPNSQLKLNFD